MGEITDQFNNVYRDFVTDGVPASGLNEVAKADVRALGPVIEGSYDQAVLAAEAAAASALEAATTAQGFCNVLSAPAAALPKEVTAISGGIATGTGGTPGTYAGGVSGGPAGFKWSYTIGSDGKLASYAITNPGLSTSSTAPTLSLPAGGLTGATVPTATVGNISINRVFLAPNSGGTQLLAWTNNAGSLSQFPTSGTQFSQYLSGPIVALFARLLYLPAAGQNWLWGLVDRYLNVAGGVLRSGVLSFKTAMFNTASIGAITGLFSKKVLPIAGVQHWTGGVARWAWAPIIDRYGRVPGYIDPSGVWRIKTAVIQNLTIGTASTVPAISWYGDSLSDGYNGFTPPITTLAAALSRTGNKFAIGGQASAQISSRQGGRARKLTISGNSIASGANTVTHIDGSTIAALEALSTGRKTGALFLSTPGNATTYTISGWLGPIRGTLTRTRPGSAEVYIFTPDVAYAALLPYPIPASQPFIVDTTATNNDTLIIWIGRNDVPATGAGAGTMNAFIAAVKAEIALMVQACPHKRFLILGVTNATDEYGSSKSDVYGAITTLNSDLAALYGNAFIDIRQQIIARGLGLMGVTPTTQDNTDIANDVLPSSLMSDTVHFNANGYGAVSKIVQERLTAEGI